MTEPVITAAEVLDFAARAGIVLMAITPAAMPPARVPHEHIWAILATQPSPTRTAETIALITCQRCHEPRTITLIGTWTHDQVRGT